MINISHPTYPIGTTFTPERKHAVKRVITDVHTTFNSRGEVVKIRYVSLHLFLGQPVEDTDVNAVTIAKGNPSHKPGDTIA